VCRCKPRNEFSPDIVYTTWCRWGRCSEWRCIGCDATLGGFGPMGCKCDGYIRELFHKDMMREEHPVPVKPSKLIRSNRKPQSKGRLTRFM
jgi:hypothetical protein